MAVMEPDTKPNWDSLDARPLPSWYDESKIGIFLHWGVFSVPSFGDEWFWYYWRTGAKQYVNYMAENYKPDFTYQDFAADFTTDLFNPNEWAEIFKASGAKYLVLTSKHHEGFTNWPSKYSFSWNSMDVGPKRDLVGELAAAIRNRTDIHFGVYHSLFEWFNPLFLQDQANNFATRDFALRKAMPELYELVERYQPEVIWSDGAAAIDTYWNSTGFLAWLYNDSPVKDVVVTNDRWGTNTDCKHGGFFSCTDRYNPGTLQKHKWENAMTIDKYSWGFRREARLADMLSMEELLSEVVSTVSCGGNILINVGPTKDGRIVPIFEERLRSLGQWLNVNGAAIYGTSPWVYQNDTVTKNVWYTSKKNSQGSLDVFAILLQWPDPGNFFLGSPTPTQNTEVTLLGYDTPIKWTASAAHAQGITVLIPAIPFNKMPCNYAWVLKLENLASLPRHYALDEY
ncbi:alpha-L-fucosidase-like isoform X2 [Dreissena polymorpha]|uniref:alpha-L-fucosidase-like isoform X2 n=1 Tax=Dreissena polymorpha TaxID=45954 RepID=UPI0022650050|nr:alpha-L-fucosidase-like isoform X2 [Dreissena polymorpha]